MLNFFSSIDVNSTISTIDMFKIASKISCLLVDIFRFSLIFEQKGLNKTSFLEGLWFKY
ncbi:hypothetical protein P689_11977 [Candidatus Riesia pediculischaeffi PTSU]|uniref:Uncharacterized protein n=1 Tax=Candidatus Riesia pediculischaeffi PTSU TaxID=1401651 RepID=A0A0C1S9X1_9ENTR|nr:hypothetical protein P689_11977 [Candidatus Riesia pediculischaeffi PTSU]